jgi:hypothetical protein
MGLKSFDPAAEYLAVMDTHKPVDKPGVPPVVVVNFVLDLKLARGERLAPEKRIAKHHFPCDAALVPIHPSAEVLKRLVAFRPGTRCFPWSRLEGQELLIRFGPPRNPGFHNPVEEISLPDGSVKALPAAQEEKQDGDLKVDPLTFTVTWHGRTAWLSDSNEFQLLVMLIEAKGEWVTHERIEEIIIQDTEYVTNRCAPLKYRLTQKLKDQGMSALAEAIVSGRRRYRLSL